MQRFLRCYPFDDPRVTLVEGFEAYDGVIGDEAGAPHGGIDYVLNVAGVCQPFSVYAMHAGRVRFGVSRTWGLYAAVQTRVVGVWYETIYAHLRWQNVDLDGRLVGAGEEIGCSGKSGLTHGIVQLHVELHRRQYAFFGQRVKVDPYGVYSRVTSRHYPQPGSCLDGVPHFWTSNDPPFPSAVASWSYRSKAARGTT